MAAHLTGIHSAIKMLNSRIRILHHYLVAMQEGIVFLLLKFPNWCVCFFPKASCLQRSLMLMNKISLLVSFSTPGCRWNSLWEFFAKTGIKPPEKIASHWIWEISRWFLDGEFDLFLFGYLHNLLPLTPRYNCKLSHCKGMIFCLLRYSFFFWKRRGRKANRHMMEEKQSLNCVLW